MVKSHSSSADAAILAWNYDSQNTRKIQSDAEITKVTPLLVQAPIKSINVSETKGAPATFSVVLEASEDWRCKIQVGAWCAIVINDQKINSMDDAAVVGNGLRCVGVVRSVRYREVVMGNGAVVRRYVVSGQDYSSVITRASFYSNAALAALRGSVEGRIILQLMDKQEHKKKLDAPRATPDELVYRFYNFFMGQVNFTIGDDRKIKKNQESAGLVGVPLLVPPEVYRFMRGTSPESRQFTALTHYVKQKLPGVISNSLGIGSNSSVWGIMQAYANLPFNELYATMLPTTIDGKQRLLPTIVHRMNPFSNTTALKVGTNQTSQGDSSYDTSIRRDLSANLEEKDPSKGQEQMEHCYVSRIIHGEEVYDQDLGLSDQERFNFFLCSPSVAGSSSEMENVIIADALKNNKVLMDRASMQRHGLRPIVDSSMYSLPGYTTKDSSPLLVLTDQMRSALEDAYLLENGTIRCAGRSTHVPLGTNVYLVHRAMVFHIEGASHDYSVDDRGERTYEVTYRVVHGKRYDPLTGIKGYPIDHPDYKAQASRRDK